MKRKFIVNSILIVETVLLVAFFFYGLTRQIQAEQAVLEAENIQRELLRAQQELEQLTERLENCH